VSVYQLFVEGKTDVEIVNAIKAAVNGNFLVTRKGPKHQLPAQVLAARSSERRQDIFLLRDRDFDFDVTPDSICPRPHYYSEIHVGWHWCRHEIENYLLEPALVCSAVSDLHSDHYHSALIRSAKNIRFFVAARWTIGYARRRGQLPPNYELQTKPSKLSDFSLPSDLSERSMWGWLLSETMAFRSQVDRVLGEEALKESYERCKELLTEDKCADIDWVLHTFPGKNLFAGLRFDARGPQLGELKNKVISFIRTDPEKAVSCIREWQELINLLCNKGMESRNP